MSGAQKLAVVGRLNALARHVAYLGLRQRFPAATAEELKEQYVRLVLGRELAERVVEVIRARRTASRQSNRSTDAP